MKRLDALGAKERAIVEERRRTGYRVDRLAQLGGELEPELRALVSRLVPGVEGHLDLAAFVDTHLEHSLGRGDRARPAGSRARRRLSRSATVRPAELFASALAA